jgi:HAMP domain-containing protein
MNSSNNLKAGQKKLSVQMLLLAVVIILVAVIGLWITQSSTGGGLAGGAKSSESTAKLLKDIYSTQTNLYKIQNMVETNQDKKEIEKLSDQQVAVISEDLNLVKQALESNISAEEKKYYSAIQNNLIEYQKSVLRFTKLAPARTGTAAYLTSANEKMEAIGQLLAQLVALESKAGSSGAGSTGMAFYVVIIMLVALLILSIVMIPSLIKNAMNTHVVEPIEETAGVLREFANGKFNKTLAWDADDAIGELVQSVNALRIKMSTPAAAAGASPAPKAATPEPVTPPADESGKSLSGMIKKTPDQESLVMSSKKAIDKLQDI